ncbi:MAG: hypothetical protein OEY10_01875, partial [Nitrosopumilus sp.]|nr:hypothetical protein [Nitrosopumilus sp.]
MTNLSIDGSIKEQLLDVSPYTYRAFFLLGLVGICVSGYLLVTGLSHFSANDSARNTFIVGGIFFQILETVCFVTVTSIPGIHRPWKYALIALGVSFFIFSISIMTIAQKATVYGGENETKAIDNELAQLNSQLKTIDSIIESFQANAGKQSKSIYAESRELGREALLDATHLIEKKEKLIGQISELQRDRKETAAGFFVQVENIVGFDARSIEFEFYFIRSLFFEISGIFCFAFGGYLRARKIEHDTQDEVANEEVP